MNKIIMLTQACTQAGDRPGYVAGPAVVIHADHFSYIEESPYGTSYIHFNNPELSEMHVMESAVKIYAAIKAQGN